MSVDDRFLRDPRVKRLAASLGWSVYECRGRLLDVFAIVYDRVNADREPLLSVEDVDTAADFPGLAARMVEFDLAAEMRHGLHIRGSKEHTNYLSTRTESGRSGGLKSGETRRNKAAAKTKVTFVKSEGPSNPLVLPSASASALDLDHALVKEDSAAPAACGSLLVLVKAKKPKPSELTAEEQGAAARVLSKLSDRSGIRYSGAFEHLRLIAAQLRRGVTEFDLRGVVAYCAEELNWEHDADMAKYLRPETLFGPKTIAKYLDPARTWVAKNKLQLTAEVA